MQNPFSPNLPGSYTNLQKRMLQRVRTARVNDQILELVQKAYENALNEENIVLSRPERKRLFSQIFKLLLEDIVNKLDDRFNS